MIYELISAVRNADVFSLFSIIICSVILLFISLPIHEYAHALIAYKLGDNTAKYQGRLTLNPIKHLDLFGSLMILLIGVGYARPVPVNMMNFKHKKRDMALVAMAGPISNFLMGVVFTFLTVLVEQFWLRSGGKVAYMVGYAFLNAAMINLSLAVFNLIPVPPFDGSRILGYFLSDRLYYKIMQYERYIFIVMLVLLATGFLGGKLSIVTNNIYSLVHWLFTLPFGG